MGTFEHLETQEFEQPTSSLAASPASHSPKPDEGKERKTTAFSGLRCLGLFASLDRDGSSVKTLRDYLLSSEAWYSSKCVLTWKEKATPSKRLLYQLSPSTRRIDATEYGLLHTPSGQEPGVTAERLQTKEGAPAKIGERAYDMHTGRLAQVGLPQQIQMLRTPNTNQRGTRSKEGMTKGHQVELQDQIRLIPTATARDARGTGKPGHKSRDSVDYLIEKGTRKGEIVGIGTGLKLQPAFALWMMGYPEDWLDLKAGEMPLSKAQAMRLSRKSQQK